MYNEYAVEYQQEHQILRPFLSVNGRYLCTLLQLGPFNNVNNKL